MVKSAATVADAVGVVRATVVVVLAATVADTAMVAHGTVAHGTVACGPLAVKASVGLMGRALIKDSLRTQGSRVTGAELTPVIATTQDAVPHRDRASLVATVRVRVRGTVSIKGAVAPPVHSVVVALSPAIVRRRDPAARVRTKHVMTYRAGFSTLRG